MSNVELRLATADDTAGMLAIYAPIIEETAISFEDTVPTLAEYRARYAAIENDFPVIVATDGTHVAGFAYAGLHRKRSAYRWSVETSVYVDPAYKRRGIGRGLYTAVFEILSALNYANALAGITLPNDESTEFHKRMGFEHVGVYPGVGYKFGHWRDTEWWNYRLRNDDEPAEPERMKNLDENLVAAAMKEGERLIR